MTPLIASIPNFAGPDMIVILLIVLLLFGAKKLPELARGMGRAVKEFGAARDEIEKGLNQSGAHGVAQVKSWIRNASDPTTESGGARPHAVQIIPSSAPVAVEAHAGGAS